VTLRRTARLATSGRNRVAAAHRREQRLQREVADEIAGAWRQLAFEVEIAIPVQ